MAEVTDKPVEVAKGDIKVEDSVDNSKQEPSTETTTESHKMDDDENTKSSNGTERKGIISDASTLAPSDDHDEIIKQVEFYFADSNLRFDKFLYSLVTAENKWVELDMVANFNRMRRFKFDDVCKAVEKSTFMEVNEDKTKIRRRVPLKPVKEGNRIVDHTIERSLYAKGFGVETATSQFDIEKLFESTGLKINAVRLRRDNDKAFKGSVFVEFGDPATLKKFMELEEKPKWDDKELQELVPPNHDDDNAKKEDTYEKVKTEEKSEDPSTTTKDKAAREAQDGVRYMTKQAFVDMKMADIKAGRIQANDNSRAPQKFDAFKDGQNSSRNHHHHNNNKSSRGRGDRNKSSHRDGDNNNKDKDWRVRRDEDRKTGFRDNRRGGGGGRDHRDRRGGGGNRRDDNNNNNDGPHDRDGNGIPKVKTFESPQKVKKEEGEEDNNNKMDAEATPQGVESGSPGKPKRAREEDREGEAAEGQDDSKKVKVEA